MMPMIAPVRVVTYWFIAASVAAMIKADPDSDPNSPVAVRDLNGCQLRAFNGML
jgi:hypothetical protein